MRRLAIAPSQRGPAAVSHHLRFSNNTVYQRRPTAVGLQLFTVDGHRDDFSGNAF
jgi:hypothetical protein